MIGELCVMWLWPMGNKKSVRGAFSQRMSSIVEEYHLAQGKEGGGMGCIFKELPTSPDLATSPLSLYFYKASETHR